MEKRRLKYKWLIVPILAVFCFLGTLLAGRNPAWIERWYAEAFYPILAGLLSAISSIFPFSLDDVFYMALIALVPTLIVLLLLRKITFRNTGKLILNILGASYIAFYLFWGFNYYRADLNTRLGIEERQPDKQELVHVIKYLIYKTNSGYCDLSEIDKASTDSLIEASYKKLAPALKIKYPAGKRKDKSITFSRLFAQSGISGYYGPFFNEVHVNKEILPVEYPAVLAHEKAHQFGITGESEANFYAWLVCSQSDSPELQYSGNLFILRYFFSTARGLKEYPQLVKMLDPKVQEDFDRIREHWLELQKESYEKVASKVNDVYLKSNKVEKGIDDYYGVVKHVMDFSQDTDYHKKYNLKTE
ncbi:DUF3810 domain-containing protein [Maribellus sediminis]|uniref:DUF3810 domain-containing protein n=1 Tax=Maribellus sediminis TaxID=2696285 RepID=UPI00142F438A|nr:DUF3810 domain-containing protein [Maribellus sediminis]